MPRVCKACLHKNRKQIDEAYLDGETVRDIEGRFPDLSRASIQRHKAHVSATLVKARDVAEITRADSLLDKVQGLECDARRLQATAEAGGDVRTAIAALRETVRIAELLARLLGELRDRELSVNVAVNVSNEPLSEHETRLFLEVVRAERPELFALVAATDPANLLDVPSDHGAAS